MAGCSKQEPLVGVVFGELGYFVNADPFNSKLSLELSVDTNALRTLWFVDHSTLDDDG